MDRLLREFGVSDKVVVLRKEPGHCLSRFLLELVVGALVSDVFGASHALDVLRVVKQSGGLAHVADS